MRRTFADILKNNKIDIKKEYSRLYDLFYKIKSYHSNTIYDLVSYHFDEIPFKGTCLSLKDFNETYEITFDEQPQNFNLEYLISFCEYIYNLVYSVDLRELSYGSFIDMAEGIKIRLTQIIEMVEYDYCENDEGITILIPKSPQVDLVAQSVSEKLSYKIFEYNHHSLKGNLETKKSILMNIAEELEPQRKILKTIDTSLEKNLFFAFNNFNIRHNNCDSSDADKYVPQFSKLRKNKKEELYDWLYNQCLIAFIKLENNDLNTKFKDIKEKIDKKII